ncbi:MAG: hypothetical protein NZO16_04985, partial [Deltaproteobacteria bacterium]|nr:hypothetical protein [Deltaproteobacteria bacterium]
MPTGRTNQSANRRNVAGAKSQASRPNVHSRPVQNKGVAKWMNPSKPNNQNNVYTLSEWIENVRGYCGLESRAQAKSICEDLARLIKDALRKQYTIPLFGLGKLFVRQTKAR